MDYEYKTSFWMDFSIADQFGYDAIEDTFNRAMKGWRTDVVYMTELVLVLNLKIWQHHEKGNDGFATLYDQLWRRADDYCYKHFKGDDLDYFISTTD